MAFPLTTASMPKDYKLKMIIQQSTDTQELPVRTQNIDYKITRTRSNRADKYGEWLV